MMNYSLFSDFFVLIMGIFIMVLLRSVRYSNKKININIPNSVLFDKTTNELIIPKKIFPYRLSEIFEINDFENLEFFTILLQNNEIINFGNYISLKTTQVRTLIFNNLKFNLSTISKNCKHLNKNKQLDFNFLSYIEDNPYVFLESKNHLLSQLNEFDSKGSLLLWTFLFEEPRVITI